MRTNIVYGNLYEYLSNNNKFIIVNNEIDANEISHFNMPSFKIQTDLNNN